jgi:hypothetical protein
VIYLATRVLGILPPLHDDPCAMVSAGISTLYPTPVSHLLRSPTCYSAPAVLPDRPRLLRCPARLPTSPTSPESGPHPPLPASTPFPALPQRLQIHDLAQVASHKARPDPTSAKQGGMHTCAIRGEKYGLERSMHPPFDPGLEKQKLDFKKGL